MSNLSDLLPAGAGGKQVDFVASGTLSSGQTVALNSDGTVSVVSGVTQSSGTPVAVASPVNSAYSSATFDPVNNKVVLAYQNDSTTYGTAVVGTVSGNTISFGTPVVFLSSTIYFPVALYDSTAGKIIIGFKYQNNSGYLSAVVGTVSGTSISFGSVSSSNITGAVYVAGAYNPTDNKVAFASYTSSGAVGQAVLATVSGTTISFGSSTQYLASDPNYNTVVYDSTNNKIIISFRDNAGALNYGKSIVGDTSGSTISFGSLATYHATATNYNTSAFDVANGKVLVAYIDTTTNYGMCCVGTVSGTSITFGTPVVFDSTATRDLAAVYDSNAGKVVISYSDSTYYGRYIAAKISGSTVSFDAIGSFNGSNVFSIATGYDSTNNKVINCYRTNTTGSYLFTAVVIQIGYTNNTDFIGITDAAISDTASGSVTIKGGISSNVTGLTPNATYYVQADGSLSTTASSVLAGKALSSTSINLDYTT